MKDFYKKDLEILIPSKDIRNYIIKTGCELSDRQLAFLYMQSKMTVEDKCNRLRKITRNTNDEELCKNISEYCNEENLRVREFINNHDNFFIYILEPNEGYHSIDKEYSINFDVLYKIGIESEEPFIIRRVLMVDYDEKKYHDCSSYIKYNENGKIMYICVSIPLPEDAYKPVRRFFEFFEWPCFFNQGDIVKEIDGKTDRAGIILTSKESYEKTLEQWRNDDFKDNWDHTNAFVQVKFIYPNGTCGYDHVDPFTLEKYDVDLQNWDCLSEMDQQLYIDSHLIKDGKENI